MRAPLALLLFRAIVVLGFAAPVAAGIERYVDETTVLAGQADLDTIDPAALEAWSRQAMQSADDAARPVVRWLGTSVPRWLRDFKASGGSTVYLVTTEELFKDMLYALVAPLSGEHARPQALAALLYSGRTDGPTTGPGRPYELYRTDAVVLPGIGVVRGAYPHIQRLKPAARPNLSEAFAAAGDAPIRIGIISTKKMRKEVLDGSLSSSASPETRQLLAGVTWVAVAVTPPPAMKTRILFQAPDARAAGVLCELIASGLAKLKNQRAAFTEAFVTPPTPKVIEKDRVTVEVNDERLLTLVKEAIVGMHEARNGKL